MSTHIDANVSVRTCIYICVCVCACALLSYVYCAILIGCNEEFAKTHMKQIRIYMLYILSLRQRRTRLNWCTPYEYRQWHNDMSRHYDRLTPYLLFSFCLVEHHIDIREKYIIKFSLKYLEKYLKKWELLKIFYFQCECMKYRQ